jgi:hypothetical protein
MSYNSKKSRFAPQLSVSDKQENHFSKIARANFNNTSKFSEVLNRILLDEAYDTDEYSFADKCQLVRNLIQQRLALARTTFDLAEPEKSVPACSFRLFEPDICKLITFADRIASAESSEARRTVMKELAQCKTNLLNGRIIIGTSDWLMREKLRVQNNSLKLHPAYEQRNASLLSVRNDEKHMNGRRRETVKAA